ncbi:DUF6892 domain-containing protein [Fulvivirga sediminis]|uniref:Uncharacterized protein n=1 Tax=Fulvivirga sediminis TaxID=2803949 RepID=A0A937FCZ2_9BACT|nr:hypothetical protein [Fulvivirga sediminis]MBL3658635.1 hypothetical protein [Fulvivirga sediminis]
MANLRLSSTGFEINNTSISFPVSLTVLESVLGENPRFFKGKNGGVYTWDELGIVGYSKEKNVIYAISASFEKEDYRFSPSQTFSGTFYIEDEDIINYYHQNPGKRVKVFEGDTTGAVVVNGVSAWFDIEEESVKAIEVSEYKPYDRAAGIPKDKYVITTPDEELISFTDFGFKLAVIEELMYTQGLLTPQFDVHEFAKWYTKREIDIDEEGYEPIAEVTQYFKDFPVPKRLAPKLTEIYQDGGNDVYMNLVPFAGGDEDYWDIESVEDAKLFPNLKKVTLCYAKEHIVDDFEKLGIEAEWL